MHEVRTRVRTGYGEALRSSIRGKTSPPVALGEADIAVGADDDVIEYRDAAKITDLTKSRGELDVSSAGGRLIRYGDLPITGVMGRSALCGRPTVPPTDGWLAMAT
jgi:hypothetical protein